MGGSSTHAFHQKVFLAAIAVYAITAWFSSDFYSADEHYQIIAFAEAKAGHQPLSELPWEYDARIRSAALPAICYCVFRAADVLHVNDPSIKAFLLRLLTALLALFVVRAFVRACLWMIDAPFQKAFMLLSYFLWFLPYQHVRFATETWSGLFVLLGLAFIVAQEERSLRFARIGACFGLAFLFKPSALLVCISAVAWLVFIKREKIASIFQFTIGALVVCAIGFGIDRWFYGSVTLTAWNFARLAIEGDPAHTFEAYPWYYYFAWIMKYGIWPIGSVMLVAFAGLTVKRPTSLFVWCIAPYLIVLSLIAHKEVRFLFPLVDLAPIVLVLAWQEFTSKSMRASLIAHRGTPIRVVMFAMIIVNVVGLAVACLSPAGRGRTILAEHIQRAHSIGTTHFGYVANETTIWKIRIPQFYLNSDVFDDGIATPCDPTHKTGDLLIAHQLNATDHECPPVSFYWIEVVRSEPEWITPLMDLYNNERDRPWVLYRNQAGLAKDPR